MNTKHTPGPWVTNGLIVSARVGASQCNVCEVSTSAPCGGRTYKAIEHMPELQANARLIAAAPELLDALKYARRFLNGADHDVAFVDAAIAKATGEQA